MNTRARAGFTLIELLVVMAIIGTLLTIALPRYFGSLKKANEVALRENLKVLRMSVDRFHGDKGRFPESLEELVTARYIRAVPVDPVTESAGTWVLVPAPDAGTPGIADIKSGAPGNSADGLPYESY